MEIPQWRKEEIDRRLNNIKNGIEKFQDFDEAINEIEMTFN